MYRQMFTPTPHAAGPQTVVDPTSIPQRLRHRTRVTGVFNGKKFELVGGGKGKPHEGILDCKMKSQHGSVGFPMPLMNVIVIFGYPTYSKHVDAFDVFKRSDGYEYERHIEFQDGGRMHSLHVVRYGGDGTERYLNGDFEVEATAEVPEDISSLTPIVETFIPDGPGRVRSQFVLAWQRVCGKLFLANCESEYRLRHQLELPELLFRQAEFVKDRSSREVLDLDERIWVTRQLTCPTAA